MRVAEFATATHAGRVRRKNEDAYFAEPPLFAVADGMGGALAGELASRISVQTLGRARAGGQRRGAPGRDRSASPTAAWPSARPPIRARRAWDRPSRRRSSGRGVVTFAHVGDSRAYLWRGGVLTRLSDDHSLVAEWVRAGALAPEEAAQHPQRSVITRALGADWQIDIDVWTTPARTGDVILLCTDGLSGFVDDAAVARTLEEHETPGRRGARPRSTRPTPRAARTTSPPSRSASRPRRGMPSAGEETGEVATSARPARSRRSSPSRSTPRRPASRRRRRRPNRMPSRCRARRPSRSRCRRRRGRARAAPSAPAGAPRAGAAARARRDPDHRAGARHGLRQRLARAPPRPRAPARRVRRGRRADAVRAVGGADRAALVALRRRRSGDRQGGRLPGRAVRPRRRRQAVQRSCIAAAFRPPRCPATRRRHLFDHSLRSSESARSLVAQLEQTEP